MNKISIIMPVYNVEKYLHTAVDSVLQQTYKNFELIVVDDGSTDKSGDISESYAKSDKRVSVVHKDNGGLSDARNAGLPHARGDYIIFIDSDDYWDKELLSELVSYNKDKNLDAIIFGYSAEVVASDGSIISSVNHVEPVKVIDKRKKANVD